MKKIYIIPNLVTTANMLCGFGSMIYSIEGDYWLASWSIIAAAFFDMMDGRIARLAKATSQFGVEYDSLSDLVSFGAAPALLIYLSMLQTLGRVGWIIAFFFMVAGALRLARFNVTSHLIPKGYFQGLPIPMGAGLVATFMIFYQSWRGAVLPPPLEVGVLLCISLALLMVSTIPFPSFKEVNWRARASVHYLPFAITLIVLVAINPEVALFGILFTYVMGSLGWNLWRLLVTRKPAAWSGIKK